MIKTISRLLALLSITTLLGCSSTPSNQFALPKNVSPQKAQLYIYRPSTAANFGRTAIIKINGKQLYSLSNGGYQAYALKPGKYRITVSDGNRYRNTSTTVLLYKKTRTFLRVTPYIDRTTSIARTVSSDTDVNKYRLEVVSKEVASREIPDTTLSMK